MVKTRTLFLIALLTPLVLAGCGQQQLNGSYTGRIKVMGASGTDTFTFDGNKVTEITNGGTNNHGTYVIENNKLLINMTGGNIQATLANDDTSFKVNTADGLAQLAKHVSYHSTDK